MTGEPTAEAVRQYRLALPAYQQAAARVAALLVERLDEAGINYLTATARAKSVESLRNKAARASRDDPEQPEFPQPLEQITDLVGARIITYLPESVSRVCELLGDELDVIADEDRGKRTAEQGIFGYASRHLQVRLREPRASLQEYLPLRGRTFEIQVRTAAQHAWAEFEHDIRYKMAIPGEWRAEVDRRFLLAAALVELVDGEFEAIDRLFRENAQAEGGTVPSRLRRPLNEQALMAFLSKRYPMAPKSKTEHYEWMCSTLMAVGIQDLKSLARTLASVDEGHVAEAMAYRFPAGQVRRLDDAVLAAMGGEAVQALAGGSAQRELLLEQRLKKLEA